MPALHDSPAAGPVVVWFRDDLRLADHPALSEAARTQRPVLCLYVLDEESPGLRPPGAAARWWLAGSLRALDASLKKRGSRLVLRRGPAATVLPRFCEEVSASAVHWNRRYGPGAAVDATAEAALKGRGVALRTFQAALLHEPPVLNKSGAPFSVFTPFWRAAQALGAPRRPLPAPPKIPGRPDLFAHLASDALEAWALEPVAPDWAGGLRDAWPRGEAAAQDRLADFVDSALCGYAQARDRPDRPATSRLSPHLRFGEISPFQVWHAARMAADTGRMRRPSGRDVEAFLAEIGWREFSWHLLHGHPDLHRANIDRGFDRFPWRDDPAALQSWQRGLTGYPLVDAGMRQLWRTGWMHNRVRMVAASFLVKHLLIDWRCGERWFWDTLVDADAANNPAGWQWVAGCGADAAPYFRIFNPVAQGERFDPDGDYVRAFVPELAALPGDAIHAPWRAPPLALAAMNVALGRTYPGPIVDHGAARERALRAHSSLRNA